MKIKIDRKSLAGTLKALKTLSSKGADARFMDVVSLIATQGYLRVSAGTGAEFASVLLEAEVEREGTCHSSFRLLDLLKAVKDEYATLSFGKVLSVTTESGLKAYLTETVKVIPIAILEEKLSKGVEAWLTVDTEALLNLIDISNVFTPTNKIRWMNLTSKEGQVYGTVEGSEYGELEALPIEGEGSEYDFVLRPDHVAPILAFCGERVRLSAVTEAQGIYMITDPDNANWWAAVQRVDRSFTKQETHE